MDFEDLKYKTNKELEALLHEKRDEMRELRFKASERQLKDASKIKTAKRAVAKILTILKMRERGEATQEKVTSTDTKNQN